MPNRAALEKLAESANGALDLDPSEFEVVEFKRVQFSLLMALVAESIPRRLGTDAPSGELAADKRMARKVANVYRTTWMRLEQFGAAGMPLPDLGSREHRAGIANRAPDAARRAGATVRWAGWLAERRDEVEKKRLQTAALALSEGAVKWGWRRIRILEEEQMNLERVAVVALSKNGAR